MPTYQVFECTQWHNAGVPVTLYCGILPAEDLSSSQFHVPQYDSASDTGYQRPITKSRLIKISNYVQHKEGLLPTSILVNIPTGAEYVPVLDPKTRKSAGWGHLHISDAATMNIMEGQHRTGALKLVAEKRQPFNYQVPVVFTLGFSEDEESSLFTIVNKEQKGVAPDLTRELQRKLNKDKAQDFPSLKKFAALEIARILNSDPNSPWFERAQTADTVVKVKSRPIRIAAFATSLHHFLSGEWAQGLVNTKRHAVLSEVVNNFWKALQSLMPEAFEDPINYNIQGPIAAQVWNEVLRDFLIGEKATSTQLTVRFFIERLSKLEEWVTSEWWYKEALSDKPTMLTGGNAPKMILRQITPLYREG